MISQWVARNGKCAWNVSSKSPRKGKPYLTLRTNDVSGGNRAGPVSLSGPAYPGLKILDNVTPLYKCDAGTWGAEEAGRLIGNAGSRINKKSTWSKPKRTRSRGYL